MRSARVYVHDAVAGVLEESEEGKLYVFRYNDTYNGEPVSLTLPVEQKEYTFDRFPPFFEGLLPEGVMLDGLLRQLKIDRNDLFSQLLAVGKEMVGAVTVEEIV
jgi:serine/threonine-protein kinase HipA